VNTNALAKLYDRLTPLERFPLILAAAERADDAEVQRLLHSAPRVHLSLPDHHGLSDGVLLQALIHVIEQLNLGLMFWHVQALIADWEAFPARKEDEAGADRLWDSVRLAAYRFCVEADGWRRLCAELKIDPDALLRGVRGYDALQFTEKAARAFLWSPEEATAYLRRKYGPGDAELPTVDEAAQAMREFIDWRVAWWDGDKG
jgi:hypothetical protein